MVCNSGDVAGLGVNRGRFINTKLIYFHDKSGKLKDRQIHCFLQWITWMVKWCDWAIDQRE